MDDDSGTTIVCTFKGKTHNLGVVDRDKFSRVSLINKVLVRSYGRKIMPNEKFMLSVWVPWDYKEVEIIFDHDLSFQLREHNKMLFYYMQLYIEEIHSPYNFVPRKTLFQHSEGSLEPNPETNFLAITNLNKLDPHAPTTNTDPSENDTNGHSKHETPVKNTSSMMMHMVAPNSIQSQTKPHVPSYQSTPKIDTKLDTNPNLYQDFLDTYFRSSPQSQTPSAAQTSAENSDSDNTSSFYIDKTPTE